jgi:hypothetical protein
MDTETQDKGLDCVSGTISDNINDLNSTSTTDYNETYQSTVPDNRDNINNPGLTS